MKKTIFLLTALSMIQVSCRKDEINPNTKPGSNWLQIDVVDGLPSNMVADIFIDDNDRVTVACLHETVSQVWVPDVPPYGTGYWSDKYTYKTSVAEVSDFRVENILSHSGYSGLKAKSQQICRDKLDRIYIAIDEPNRILVYEADSWSSIQIGTYNSATFSNLVSDGDGIWFSCSSSGLIHLNQSNDLDIIFEDANPIGDGGSIYDMEISSAGTMYYFCWNSLNKCDGSTISNIQSFNTSGGILCLAADGILWTLANKEGASGYDLYLSKYSTSGNIVEENIIEIVYPAYRDLVVDSKGIFWISVYAEYYEQGSNGLYKFDGNTLTHFNTSNSDIPSNKLTDMVVDSKDNLWIATEDAGLIIYKNI
ncbi:hypothetical protein JYT74_03610 [Crocinitomix catalasitica]|nr:hypothetical protein [Crocinitomix catalasitica]